MEIRTIIIIVFMVILDLMFLYFILPILTNKRAIKYLIKNKDIIKIDNSYNHYILDKCNLLYYKDITIKQLSENKYEIIFWGNRDSWRWSIKLDKVFVIENNNKINKELINIIKNVNTIK